MRSEAIRPRERVAQLLVQRPGLVLLREMNWSSLHHLGAAAPIGPATEAIWRSAFGRARRELARRAACRSVFGAQRLLG